MQFHLLASHAEARQRRKTANKLFFALFFCAMSSPFCLRKNSLLFPNPQPIARPLPTAGPKLNKSVVCMRKLLGWGEGSPKTCMEATLGLFTAIASLCTSTLLNSESKRIFGPFLGSAVLICFCYLLFCSLYSMPWSVSVCQPWGQPALSHPQAVPSAAQVAVHCCHGKLQVNVEMLRGKQRSDQREIKIKKAQLVHLIEKASNSAINGAVSLSWPAVTLGVYSDLGNTNKTITTDFCNMDLVFVFLNQEQRNPNLIVTFLLWNKILLTQYWSVSNRMPCSKSRSALCIQCQQGVSLKVQFWRLIKFLSLINLSQEKKKKKKKWILLEISP